MALRAAGRLGLWLATAAALAWLSAACLLGHVEHTVSSLQISGGRVIGTLLLPSLVRIGQGELQLELFEDGRRLGPRVEEARRVREMQGGSYAVLSGRRPLWSPTRMYFSASDGSTPSSNGRLYTVRYPRRQLPAAIALLLGSWIVLPLVTLRCLRRRADAPGRRKGRGFGAAAWSVGVLGALYSLFAVQAWLPPPNTFWFLALLAVVLPPFLARLSRRQVRLPLWFPWLAGLIGWAGLTSVAGSSYASPATAIGFFAISVGGCVAYFGVRGVLERGEDRTPLVLVLFVFVVALSLARDAGFDIAGSLAAVGLSSIWPLQVVNPWTTKFYAHWLLIGLWCSLAALGWHRSSPRRAVLWVGGLAVVALAANGSKAAMAGLLISAATAALALRWPKPVRHLVVYGLVAAVLSAPLLAAVPWRARSELASHGRGAAWSVLDLDGRSGKWEFSRRLITLRPVHGWGLGASGRLPGRDLSVDQALGPGPSGGASAVPTSPALAGGHPHNAALLTWLDLGLIGALLVAGLVAASGRSIGSIDDNRRAHAALLGLLTVTTTYLMFNYPVWEPEVASILWMSVALPSALLPRPVTMRRQLLLHALAVLVIVSLGLAVLAQTQLSHSLSVRNLRDGEVVLDHEGRRLIVGGDIWPLHEDRGLDAVAKLLPPGPQGTTAIHGWVHDPSSDEGAKAVLVFVGSELAGIVRPERPSPELFVRSQRRDIRSLVSGFVLPTEADRLDLDAPVTIVSMGPEGALATELPPLRPAGAAGELRSVSSPDRAPAGSPATAPRTAAPRNAERKQPRAP